MEAGHLICQVFGLFVCVCICSEMVEGSFSEDGVVKSVSHLRDELEPFCTQEIAKISERDSHQLTLDPNTVNKFLRLSEDNREITDTYTQQHQYPDHPDRFDVVRQVLCRESVCGRSYWEIEWSGDVVYISVSYKSIRRKGQGHECVFGCNDQSWSLICSHSSYSFRHNNIKTDLSVKFRSNTIGVYVDERAGILSFYSVSDTKTLIHSIRTTFTQPLYPGFRLGLSVFFLFSKVKLCDLTM